MFDLDKWQEIFGTIRKNKLRTFLTAFSIIWGIFMLVFMLGMGKGLENGVHQDFGNHATNSCYVWGQRTTKAYAGLQPGRKVRFDSRAITYLENKVEGLAYIAPRVNRGGVVRYGKQTIEAEIRGDVPEYQKINPIEILYGRFINKKDVKDKRKIVILGKRVVEVLFKQKNNYESVMGKYVKFNGTYFQIVGVFKSHNKGEEAIEEEESVYIPLSTMQILFKLGERIWYFSFLTEPKYSVAVVEKKVKQLLKQFYKVSPEDDSAIGSFNMEKEYSQIQNLFLGIKSLVWFVGICSILSGVVGVSNIMLIVVKERTKEIGIRKALGANRWSLISLILQESVFLTTLAGYIGLVMGVGLIELLRQSGMEGEMFTNPQVDLKIVATALVFLIIVGLLAGLFPAQKAASVNPVEALRDE